MPAAGRILVAASSAAAVLALAPPAGAATVKTSRCVPSLAGLAAAPNDKTMGISGTGFTPGATVTIRYASAISPTPAYLTAVPADPAGNFETLTAPPMFNRFNTQQQDFAISATDSVNPALVAGTTFKQVRVGYSTNPSRGRPTARVKHTVRGFPVGKNTYLHFRYGGQTKRNVLVGRATSPCGTVSRRMALLPTRSRRGTWTVYVDQARTYSRKTPFQLKYKLLITVRFR